MVAAHGKELFKAVGENVCDLCVFEASVAGGPAHYPAFKECLAANRIRPGF